MRSLATPRARASPCGDGRCASLHSMARDDDDGDGDAHYAGLFLDADARRKVWALAHRLLGMSCAPPGAKSSADHVTLAHAPDRDATTRVLELARRRRSRAVTVTMTHACVRPRAMVMAVSIEMDRELTGLETPATPHVSVFAPETMEWRTLGDVVAEDLARDEGLDLRALGASDEALRLECRLGVKMRDGSVDFGFGGETSDSGRHSGSSSAIPGLASPTKNKHSLGRTSEAAPRATSTRPEYMTKKQIAAAKAKAKAREEARPLTAEEMAERAVAEAKKQALKEEKRRNNIRREYLSLCEMFEEHHPEFVKTTFIRFGYDMEATAQDLLASIAPDIENMYDNDEYYSEYDTEDDEYGSESEYDSEPESEDNSSKKEGISKGLSKKIRRAQAKAQRRKARDEETTRRLQAAGLGTDRREVTITSGTTWVSKPPPSSTPNWEVSGARAEIINAAKHLAFLQGPKAKTQRLSVNLSDRNAARLEELSEEMSRLRVQRDRGDTRAAALLGEKAKLKQALESIDTEVVAPSTADNDNRGFNRVIDFHGYDRLDAIRRLERELLKIAPMVSSDWSIKLITGRGNHSRGGRVIHGDIMRWLTQNGIAFDEGLGHVVVRTMASINQ